MVVMPLVFIINNHIKHDKHYVWYCGIHRTQRSLSDLN